MARGAGPSRAIRPRNISEIIAGAMEHSKIKSYIEVATNVAVLLAAVTVVAFFAYSYFAPPPSPVRLQTGLQKGQVLPQIEGLDYSKSPQTLLIAMNTKCKFCTSSVPFYNQLVEKQKQSGKEVRIVAAFSNAPDEVQQYVAEKQFAVETLAAADLAKLGLVNTPTVVLVDNKGRILNFWMGQLPAEGEKHLLDTMNLS